MWDVVPAVTAPAITHTTLLRLAPPAKLILTEFARLKVPAIWKIQAKSRIGQITQNFKVEIRTVGSCAGKGKGSRGADAGGEGVKPRSEGETTEIA